MDWTQAFTIIGVLGGFTFWLFTKIDGDVKASNARQDAQIARIDQLYGVILELLKEGRK